MERGADHGAFGDHSGRGDVLSTGTWIIIGVVGLAAVYFLTKPAVAVAAPAGGNSVLATVAAGAGIAAGLAAAFQGTDS
jgi:hypothetical protein